MSYVARVVLDTNVLLSGIAFPGSVPGKILAAWRQGAVDVVLSDFILEELRRVLPRLASRHGLSGIEMDELVEILFIQATVVAPNPTMEPSLRDPQDQPVLGTLLAAQLENPDVCLITGDKDLLVLAPRYAILTPADFWVRYG